MIFDCFTFFNELDMLELRLAVLEDVVDRFVLCEAPFTFRGEPKPLQYAEQRARFARWNDRIVHLVYDAAPDPIAWRNEWGQRAFLTTAIAAAAPGDIILIGDVDELPAPQNCAFRSSDGRIAGHRQMLATGYFNRITGGEWIGTRSIARGDLGERSLHDIRQTSEAELTIVDGGWHFTSLGGPAVAGAKMHAYSHAEFDIPYATDERRIGAEYDAASSARWVPFDDAFPAPLHAPRWSRFVWPKPAARTEPREAKRVGALVPGDVASWERVGTERLGEAFAGAVTEIDALLARLAAGDWAVVDGLERLGASDLRALAAHGLGVVAAMANARSFAAIDAVLDGGAFANGRARGRDDAEAAIAHAGYRIERRDAIHTRTIFAPLALLPPELLGAGVGRIHFERIAREAFGDFTAHGFLFVLRPPVP
jgi:hypothetical protein